MLIRRIYIKRFTLIKLWTFFIYLICLCVCTILIFMSYSENIPTKKEELIKTILYWNNADQNVMKFGLGSKIFEGCPIHNCYATNDTSYVNIDDFDAIIFHYPSFDYKRDGIPQRRKINQKYIFYR